MYINRQYLLRVLSDRLSLHMNTPTTQEGYALGVHLGVSDCIQDIIELVKTMPQDEQARKPRYPLGDPRREIRYD